MIKEIIGIIAVILVFISYAPYIRDTLSGKTTPHIYSWFVWGLLTAIIFALQLHGGAGPGAYVTLSVTIVLVFIFILGLRSGKKDITLFDTIFFIAALAATAIWLFAKQPVLSIILLCIIDLLGFAPTVRKSWHKPHQETLFTWALNGFRHGLSIFALQHYNILTLLYPILWTSANLVFSALLITRRRQLAKKNL